MSRSSCRTRSPYNSSRVDQMVKISPRTCTSMLSEGRSHRRQLSSRVCSKEKMLTLRPKYVSSDFCTFDMASSAIRMDVVKATRRASLTLVSSKILPYLLSTTISSRSIFIGKLKHIYLAELPASLFFFFLDLKTPSFCSSSSIRACI